MGVSPSRMDRLVHGIPLVPTPVVCRESPLVESAVPNTPAVRPAPKIGVIDTNHKTYIMQYLREKMPGRKSRRHPDELYDLGKIADALIEIINETTVSFKDLTQGCTRSLLHIAHARQKAMFVLRGMNLSLMVLKRIFNRDHTTIIFGVRAHQKRLDAGTAW